MKLSISLFAILLSSLAMASNGNSKVYKTCLSLDGTTQLEVFSTFETNKLLVNVLSPHGAWLGTLSSDRIQTQMVLKKQIENDIFAVRLTTSPAAQESYAYPNVSVNSVELKVNGVEKRLQCGR